MLRMLLNVLVALMLAGILAGAAWHARAERERQQHIEEVRDEVFRFQRQITLRSALREAPVSSRGYPMRIEPEWFEEGLPRNILLPTSHPWLEIAGEDQRERLYPPDPIAVSRVQATFWYNPHTGVLRARVPAAASDDASISLYNRVNSSSLTRW